MAFTAQVAGQDVFASATTAAHALGCVNDSGDGRLFRYAHAGAVATVAGKLYQGAAPIPNHLANTPPDVAAGVKSFVYTPGATAGAENLYADGYLQVDTTPGEGYTYRVSGHAAISSATAFTLFLKDPIQVAITAAGSTVGLVPSPWQNIIVHPSQVTAKASGVAAAVIAIGAYGWVQTRGPCSVLIDGTPAITAPVFHERFDEVRQQQQIGIERQHPVPFRQGDGLVLRGGESDVLLVVDHLAAIFEVFENVHRAVSRIVVDDDNFFVEIPLLQNGFEAPLDEPTAIICDYCDRDDAISRHE